MPNAAAKPTDETILFIDSRLCGKDGYIFF